MIQNDGKFSEMGSQGHMLMQGDDMQDIIKILAFILGSGFASAYWVYMD